MSRKHLKSVNCLGNELKTHTQTLIGHGGIVWSVYLESWIKTYLNLTLVVKSQKLYRQHSYTPYQQKLFDLCIKFQKEGMGYRKISQHLTQLGFKSIRGKELKQNHVYSIIKKGLIRKNRMMKLKSHNDYKYQIKDMSLLFKDIEN